MVSAEKEKVLDFLAALGEEFGDLVSPPVPFDEASPHECCEALWLALGTDITPTMLSKLDTSDLTRISNAFGQWFECEAPQNMQLSEAIARTISRWPPGSIGEHA